MLFTSQQAFGIPQYNPLKEIRVPTVPQPFRLSSTRQSRHVRYNKTKKCVEAAAAKVRPLKNHVDF